MPAAESEELTEPTDDVSYVLDATLIRSYVAGQMKQTDNPLDVAINGAGWFSIETPAGEQYSRDGHFTLNEEGTLVTAEGHPVLGQSGTIVFGAEETRIAIASDGTVSSTAGEKGKLKIVSFDNEALLQKEGSNLFSSSQPGFEIEVPRVAQGFIENSNVNAVSEMAKMIEVTRSYMSTARALEQLAELKTQAINDLADIQV